MRLVCALLAGGLVLAGAEVWTFDRLDKIGGHRATALGHPRVIKTPLGKGVEFNGVDDALFIDDHPLAGAEVFTFEAIFRPAKGGAAEQRWFHLAEQDAKGADTGTRVLFETRLVGDNWYLDAFVQSGQASKVLVNPKLVHPLDEWHRVAMVYDGKEFRSYVDGVLEGQAAAQFAPQGKGHSSVGVRINKVNYCKGAVRQARFSRKALTPEEFLKLPAAR